MYAGVLFFLFLVVSSTFGATRVWDVTNGVWSTYAAETPWAGRSFANGDTVYFPDVVTQDGISKTSQVVVTGTVLPAKITFENTKTILYEVTHAVTAQIGDKSDLARPDIIKSGSGTVCVSAPFYPGNVRVSEGRFDLHNMMDLPWVITVNTNAYIYVNTRNVETEHTDKIILSPGATYHRGGEVYFRNPLVLPYIGTTETNETRWVLEETTAPSLLVQSNAHVFLIGELNASFTNLNTGSISEFTGGGTIPSFALHEGTVLIKEGEYAIGSYATNAFPTAPKIAIGGNGPRVSIEESVKLDNTDFSVYGKDTFVSVPELYLGEREAYNQTVLVSNRADLTVGELTFVPVSSLQTERVIVCDEGVFYATNRIAFSTNFMGDARLIISNGTACIGGVGFAPKLSGRVQQILVSHGGTLALGGNNSGELFENTTTAPKNEEMGLVMAGGTLRFAESFTNFRQNLYLQAYVTNVVELNGYEVVINGSILGNKVPPSQNVVSRLEIQDSDAKKRGRVTFKGKVNKLSNNPGPEDPEWGLNILSGVFRLDISDSSKKGTSLRGGILEVPGGYNTYKGNSAPVTLYEAAPGSVVRVFKDKAIHTTIKELNVAALNPAYVTVSNACRNLIFELVDETTGELIPGARFYDAHPSGNYYFIRMDWSYLAEEEQLHSLTWIDGETTWSETSLSWYGDDNTECVTNYMNSVNLYFTNLQENTLISLSKSTAMKTLVAKSMVMGNNHGHTVNITGDEIVGVSVISNLSDTTKFDLPLVVHNDIVVTGGCMVLTNLYTRAFWTVSEDAVLFTGFHSSGDTFDEVSPFIKNNGELIYSLNGRTERMTQPILYRENALANYGFQNGTLVLDTPDTDYLARYAGTNVWILQGCTLQLKAQHVLGVNAEQPIGLHGGILEISVDNSFSRGIVMQTNAVIQLDPDVHAIFHDGAVIAAVMGSNTVQRAASVTEGHDPFLQLQNEVEFRIEEGATLLLDVPLTGNANVRKTGKGTLFLNTVATSSGTFDVREGAVHVVNREAFGAMTVTVQDGAILSVDEEARPFRIVQSLILESGSRLVIGPDSATIEPKNPIQILTTGSITMKAGACVKTRLTTSEIANGQHGVTDNSDVRTYNNAVVFDNMSIDLFNLARQLIWDMEEQTGSWFSVATNTPDVNSDSQWHVAAGPDASRGYGNNPKVNFENDLRPGVTFLTPTELTVTDETPLYPQTITFPSNLTGRVVINAGTIGSPSNRVNVQSLNSNSSTNEIHSTLYPLTIVSETGTSLILSHVAATPDVISVREGSRILFCAQEPLTLFGNDFQGKGTFVKFGQNTVSLNLEGVDRFYPTLEMDEGLFVLTQGENQSDSPPVLMSELVFGGKNTPAILDNRRTSSNVTFIAGLTLSVEGEGTIKGSQICLQGDFNIAMKENAVFSNCCVFASQVPSLTCRISGKGMMCQFVPFATGQGKANLFIEPESSVYLVSNTVHLAASDVTIGGTISGRGTVKAMNSLTLSKNAVVLLAPGDKTIGENALTLDLEGAAFHLPNGDGSLTLDATQLGVLNESHSGKAVLHIKNNTDLEAYMFQLKYDSRTAESWALKKVRIGNDTYLRLTKSQGAVFVYSPIAAEERPDSFTDSREFAPSGKDYALIPSNFNSSPDLHNGVIIRDRYTGKTDGPTREQIAAVVPSNPNNEYWFWFEGGNGCWNNTSAYTLHLYADVDDNVVSYTQFAVTNQVFFGNLSDLDFGEVGFYVSEQYDDIGGLSTNLIVRLFSSSLSVQFPLSGKDSPWLVVSVKAIPYEGYEVVFNNQTNLLKTVRAGLPRRLIITGVSPVDNLYVSLGNPDRTPLVYVHDMTEIDSVPVNRPLDVEQVVLDKVVNAAVAQGFSPAKPVKKEDSAETLYVDICTLSKVNGAISDSRVVDRADGSSSADMAYMLNLPLYSTNMVSRGGHPLYQLYCAYTLGINRIQVRDTSVSVYAQLSGSLSAYDVLGTTENPHEIRGYVVLQGTDNASPFTAAESEWKMISISPSQMFSESGINELPIKNLTAVQYRYYRVKIMRIRPSALK